MDIVAILSLIAFSLIVLALGAIWLIRHNSSDARAQRELETYIQKDLSNTELGLRYERYVGYLFEQYGYKVLYNGAVNGVKDLGRDLIVSNEQEVIVIQAKCWAKTKVISAKHIFELYGTTRHYELTNNLQRKELRAIFYTSANYPEMTKKVAHTLGVELRTEVLTHKYPMIKCSQGEDGEKVFYLPTHERYDRINVDFRNGDSFVRNVSDATKSGYKRAG